MAGSAAAGEWLRGPGWLWALAAILLFLLAAALRRGWWIAAPLVALAALLGLAQSRIDGLVRRWPAAREARIEADSALLARDLEQAWREADRTALEATRAADLAPEAGFAALAKLVRGAGIESGVALFERDATPRAWAGRFRLAPEPAGDSVSVRLTPYYAVLEVRRHAVSGRTAVAALLLAAEPAVPDPERSVAARFTARTEVGLRLLAPHLAPNSTDVFDYGSPDDPSGALFFSAQFVPPGQAESIERARHTGGRWVAWGLMLVLAIAAAGMPAGWGRFLFVFLPFGLALRAPLGWLLGIPAPFDPGVFSSTLLGAVSSSAGPLAIVGLLVTLLAIVFWEQRLGGRRLNQVAAATLLVGAPYLLSVLGRGIVPPLSGVSVGLWLVWHLTLFLVGAGLVVLAAALLRNGGPAREGWLLPLAGAALGLLAAAVGVKVWNARYGWPDWYTLLWLPPLALVTRPANRRATIFGIAVVAGSATAVLAWGAAIEGRLAAARRDMAALGDTPDPILDSNLQALGDSLRGSVRPGNASELYALWLGTALSREGRPVVLGLWTADGTPRIELALDELDAPVDLLGAVIRNVPRSDSVVVQVLRREPALHHLLLVRLRDGTLLSVVTAPRSALIPRSRQGRLLDPIPRHTPLYRLSLAPAPSAAPVSEEMALWHREQWLARGERTVAIAGVPRDVAGTVDLGSPETLVVRGALVVALDAALLAALWGLVALLVGRTPHRPSWMPAFHSFEARLGVALSVFFLAPTLGFAAWGVGRLRAEIRDGRDRVIAQTLRDVAPASASLAVQDSALGRELGVLSNRVDADFVLYRDGRLMAGSSGGLLEALGLVGPLMDPEAYHRIALHGDAEASAAGPSRAVEVRVGYHAVRLSDLSAGVLALPQGAADPILGDEKRDLALVLLLATMLGIVASVLAARVAARALAQPVAELGRAAHAFGQGVVPTPPEPAPPTEFAPVFAAFARMTEDVRRTQEAQEQAARIVAWGEMASQVAHEIKNPLTPMRLGIQHLRRVHQDARTPIGPVLAETTARILAEIDRLDRIARAFSRFGVPASERGPLERVTLARVARDVADLYQLGGDGEGVRVVVEGEVAVSARVDEMKETLVNLVENARNAGASTVRIRIRGTELTVEDNGSGIPAPLLARIFEPRFSTSTSGSGLGMPIVKRLVEGWGGQVSVESTEGEGTIVRLQLVAEPAPAA